MSGFGLQNVKWEAFNRRLGLRVVITVLLALVLAEWIGLAGPVVALGALFTSLQDFHGPIRARMAYLAGFTVVMAIVTALAWVVAGDMWPTVVGVFVVVLLGGLAMAFGPRQAAAGSILSVWLAIWLGGFGTESLGQSVLAAVLGGALAMVLVLIFAATASRKQPATSTAATARPDQPKTGRATPPIDWRPPSEFAVTKAVATSVATIVGWLVVGSHPFWVTYAPLAIIKPDRHETGTAGLNRLIGTLLGAIVGFVLIAPLADTTLLFVLFLAVVFLQAATMGVHYAIFVFFLTLNVILSGALEGSRAEGLSADRLVANIIGIAIALVTIAILSHLRPSKSDSESQRPS